MRQITVESATPGSGWWRRRVQGSDWFYACVEQLRTYRSVDQWTELTFSVIDARWIILVTVWFELRRTESSGFKFWFWSRKVAPVTVGYLTRHSLCEDLPGRYRECRAVFKTIRVADVVIVLLC